MVPWENVVMVVEGWFQGKMWGWWWKVGSRQRDGDGGGEGGGSRGRDYYGDGGEGVARGEDVVMVVEGWLEGKMW